MNHPEACDQVPAPGLRRMPWPLAARLIAATALAVWAAIGAVAVLLTR